MQKIINSYVFYGLLKKSICIKFNIVSGNSKVWSIKKLQNAVLTWIKYNRERKYKYTTIKHLQS